jgi:predicted amidophosphoribosyltransferase
MALLHDNIQIGNASYPHYYLCGYLPASAGRDTLSHSLLRFKLGRQPDLSGWIDCILETLATLPILPHTTIVRALHHDETTVPPDSPASLDKLGAALAARFHSDYRPSLLRKHRPSRPIKEFSKEKRTDELRDLYYIGEPALPSSQPARSTSLASGFPIHPGLPAAPILILDDILTTGATVAALLAALLPYFPHSSFTIFTLARATYEASPNESLPLKGQNYQLEQGMNWTMAEEGAAAYYPAYSGRQLMAWIEAGSFP